MQSILFRADGNSEIGLGHLVRSSALSCLLKPEFDCTLATRCNIEPILKKLSSSFTSIVTLPERPYLDEAKQFSSITSSHALIVLDGYHFDSDYQKQLFDSSYDFFCIDDIHAFSFFSKGIINHSGGITPLDYKALPGTTFYLGLQYALLQEPFLEAAKTRRNAVTNNRCLVCFGGADPENHTMQILNDPHISQQFEHIDVVVGAAYQHYSELKQWLTTKKHIAVHYNVASDELVKIMQACSYLICSPSTIAYEYLSVGGIAFLKQTADNQHDIFNYLTTEGLCFKLDQIGVLSPDAISYSFKQQSIVFDGNAGSRLKKIFRIFFEGKRVKARRAMHSDLELCFTWANDPQVRSQSYHSGNISLEEHTNWFNKQLNSSDTFFYILELNGEPMGQIRFSIIGDEAVLGYLTAAKFRSQGLGSIILQKGIEAFITDYSQPVNIVGYVKTFNSASQRSFEKLAFDREISNVYANSFKYIMKYAN